MEKTAVEEKILIYSKALADLCKKARVKTPDRLIGKKIIMILGDKDGKYFAMSYGLILRVSIEVAEGYPFGTGLFMRVDRIVLRYNSEEKSWFRDESGPNIITAGKGLPISISFPRRIFSFFS